MDPHRLVRHAFDLAAVEPLQCVDRRRLGIQAKPPKVGRPQLSIHRCA
jgi:hypothetical protein